jgi:hypothetical protein
MAYWVRLSVAGGGVGAAAAVVCGRLGLTDIGASLVVWTSAGAVMCVVYLTLPPRRSVGRAVALLLDHGLCAACGYSLAEISTQQDGCRVCPECGAAWRVREVVRTGR